MEDRKQNRREANQVRVEPHRAPRDCALGKPTLHTQPEGWAASRARRTHPVCLCQGPQTALLLHLLAQLSPCASSCEQAALQRARAPSHGPSRSHRSTPRGSGTLQ